MPNLKRNTLTAAVSESTENGTIPSRYRGLRRGGGRPKGAPNKVTKEIRALSQVLFDDDYWVKTRARLLNGRLAPAVETKLLAYAYGEPKHIVDVLGLGEMAAALARKVVDELHPGPTKSPDA